MRKLLAFAAVLLVLVITPPADAFVYWTDFPPGPIGRANLDGTDAEPKFISKAGWVCGVEVDGQHIYWGLHNAIGRANLDGSGVDMRFITGLPLGVCVGAVDANYVYFTTRRGGDLARVNLDGTGIKREFIPGVWSGVAIDADHIYWTKLLTNRLGRANLDGSGVDPTFITGLDSPAGIAVNDHYIYWANDSSLDGDGSIGRANLNGTGADPTFLDAPIVDPWGVAVDDNYIYWADFHLEIPGTLGRANLDGTDATNDLMPSARTGVEDVAVDALTFTIGGVKLNREAGTAKLRVRVPGPGDVRLIETARLKAAGARAAAEGRVTLPVMPKRKAKELLDQQGRARVKAKVTFDPDDGPIERQPRPIVLKQKARA